MGGGDQGDGGRPGDEARSDSRSEDRGEAWSAARARVEGEALEDVLASIRALVSAETSARLGREDAGERVLMLTPEMRVEEEAAPVRSGELLAEGLDAPPLAPRAAAAPILDEEALRGVVNRIVREELQGELGDRISRNLRKLIRREIGQVIEERKEEP